MANNRGANAAFAVGKGLENFFTFNEALQNKRKERQAEQKREKEQAFLQNMAMQYIQSGKGQPEFGWNENGGMTVKVKPVQQKEMTLDDYILRQMTGGQQGGQQAMPMPQQTQRPQTGYAPIGGGMAGTPQGDRYLMPQVGGQQQAQMINPIAPAQGGAFGLDSSKLMRGAIAKKLGVPYSEIQTPQEKQAEMDMKAQEEKNKARAKASAESELGEQIADQNVALVAGSARRLAQTYADAYREGGVGSKVKQIKSGTALFLGGEGAEKYGATGAYPGQKIEVITKMMPLLTQQGSKPGSVRLVSTVVDKLIKTLPAENTPPKVAKRMMVETVRNMYGFSKAIKKMRLTNEQVSGMSQSQLKALGNQIESYSRSISLSESEKMQLEDLIKSVTGPIDEVSQGKTRVGNYIVEVE